jgi:predicted phage tail protein|tara:strand:- start:181 stop:477 length:297 start_codon:yes stop_codon:yes gene_type:complete
LIGAETEGLGVTFYRRPMTGGVRRVALTVRVVAAMFLVVSTLVCGRRRAGILRRRALQLQSLWLAQLGASMNVEGTTALITGGAKRVTHRNGERQWLT